MTYEDTSNELHVLLIANFKKRRRKINLGDFQDMTLSFLTLSAENADVAIISVSFVKDIFGNCQLDTEVLKSTKCFLKTTI